MTTGVYCIRHAESHKVYVGSAVDINRRWKDHKTRLNCEKHGNDYLQRAWSKYGQGAFEFEVLEECAVPERLIREQHWIDTLQAADERRGFNLIPTRGSQLYGAACSRLQKRRWSPYSKEERAAKCVHLNGDPVKKAEWQKLASAAKSGEAYSELRREIAKRGLTTEANRAGNSARLKAKWADPEFRAARLAGLDRGRQKTNARRKLSIVSSDEIV